MTFWREKNTTKYNIGTLPDTTSASRLLTNVDILEAIEKRKKEVALHANNFQFEARKILEKPRENLEFIPNNSHIKSESMQIYAILKKVGKC